MCQFAIMFHFLLFYPNQHVACASLANLMWIQLAKQSICQLKHIAAAVNK